MSDYVIALSVALAVLSVLLVIKGKDSMIVGTPVFVIGTTILIIISVSAYLRNVDKEECQNLTKFIESSLQECRNQNKSRTRFVELWYSLPVKEKVLKADITQKARDENTKLILILIRKEETGVGVPYAKVRLTVEEPGNIVVREDSLTADTNGLVPYRIDKAFSSHLLRCTIVDERLEPQKRLLTISLVPDLWEIEVKPRKRF